MKLRELAERIGGRISGDPDIEITGVSGINDAGHGDITYFAEKKYLQNILSSNASAVIAKEEIAGLSGGERPAPMSVLIVDNPQYAFARALEVFYAAPAGLSGISDKAVIGSNVSMGGDISVHPFAFIGNNTALGRRVTVSTGVFIGENVSIGDGTFIYPNVTIRENVTIGRNVIIHPGTVIGSDGFGYVLEKGAHYKIPHVGGVIIEDDVEIGANVTIDRATVGNTIIGCGTKIDNLVQVGHNVRIGKNCIIVAAVAIAGSVEIGDWAVLAGQVGVRDHIRIGSKAVVSGQSGVMTDVPEGEVYSGKPAIPHKTWMRAQSIFSKLPEYVQRLKELEKRSGRPD